MTFKKTILAMALAASVGLPAFAANLTIINNTTKDSTSIINSGLCSTKILGNDGITSAKSSKVIKDFQIRLACMTNFENCKADVYLSNDCSGDVITQVIFSVKSGIKSVAGTKPGYLVTYTPFSIKIDEVA